MNEQQPPAPEQDPQAAGSPPAGKPASALPASVLAMGFVAVTLVGVLIASAVRSKPAAAKPGEDAGLKDARARIQLLQENVNRERAKLGLSPLYGDTAESAEEVAARITDDAATLVALAKNVQEVIADKQAEIDRRTREWTDAVKLQEVLRGQLAHAEEKLAEALVEGSGAAALRGQLDAANKRVIALNDEVRRLSEAPVEMKALAAERDSLRARVQELESRLSQASLFAGTESELFQEAVELFRQLRELENKPDSEINTAYSKFGARLGANVLDKIDFPTGSSDLPPEDVTKIAGFAAEAPDNALLIVIGYASETGNVDSNRTLSSERATAVARVLDQAKKPGQRVQAAYLGQTDRFGSKFPERNQISEVWQIVPKAN